MSRISSRAPTVAAVLGIVLLVILLVILWTGVRTTTATQKEEEARRGYTVHGLGGLLNESATAATIAHDSKFASQAIPEADTLPTEQHKSNADGWAAPGGDLEYVKLVKLSENQYEDPPDEFSTATRHDTGHFRHSTAEVWDPHPQYEFTAFGRQFRLRLSHDSSFVSPNIKITYIGKNTTWKEHPGHELGCFYTGTVDGDPDSDVSVSLCHGMTGHVKTSTGSYIINPAEPWREDDKDSVGYSQRHTIERLHESSVESNHVDDVGDQSDSRNCGVIDDDTPTPISDDTSDSRIYVGGRVRKRRSLPEETSFDRAKRKPEYEELVAQSGQHRNFLQNDDRYERYYSVEGRRNDPPEEDEDDSEAREYFIEIMVVADARMIRYHGKRLNRYVLNLMSMVSRIYKDPSIGNPISISVIKIVHMQEVFASRQNGSGGVAATELLRKFCIWQKENNPKEPSPYHHDVALLLTRENLCLNNHDRMRCDTLGLAEMGRICYPESSCAIAKDNGLAAAFTIAHEIGHVLNMPHEDHVKCAPFRNATSGHNIMSKMLDNNTNPWVWSQCSRHHVTEFLESGNGNCLLDEPANTIEKEDPSRLPGEDYSQNQQCELAFGRGYRICPDTNGDVCRRLWCTAPNWDRADECHTQNMPWADRTPCGVDKWCHRSECVSRRSLKSVDGQWGEWKEYGECSRTCGGGVMRKYRECNNPVPQNNGKYCVGKRVKYRSCATEECPQGSIDFRELQCSQFDNKTLGIKNLSSDVKWHVKESIIPAYPCALYCQVESKQFYKLPKKVIDGTPCGPDTFHVCVNGQCKPAGCDHVLYSTAELDACGVCRGDNSTCQTIRGSYNFTQDGYRTVTTIPAGSSNIDIRQRGWMDKRNDSIYLALRLGEQGDYILNGRSIIMPQGKVILQPGQYTIEYSGPNVTEERLNSSRPIGTDLTLQVLSVCNNCAPQITYEYTVPKKILNSYTWVLSEWSECSHTCQGIKYRRAECRSTERKDVVYDGYCREEEKPREQSRICNTHCILQWNITSMSECSSHCGPGTRTVTYRCTQILRNFPLPPQPILARACAHLPRPSHEEPCTGPCKSVHWSYQKWGSCSVTCGGGVQTRMAVCVDSNDRPVPEDRCAGLEKHLRKHCGQDTCPKWDLGKWTPCSVTCGEGIRERKYFCQRENRVVPDSECGDLPHGVVQICNAGPCEQWQAGDWNPCSVTCGEGIRRRKVICKRADGMTSNKCSPSDKPDDLTTCTLKPCPTVVNATPIKYVPGPPHDDLSQQDNEVKIVFRSGYEWLTDSYAECSRPCTDGYMHTVVQCVSIETRTIAPDDYCDRKKKPSSLIACNRDRCPRWNTGDWSQCNVECGTGSQHRQVRCQSPNGEILPDENCHDSQKPEVVNICYKNPCATGPADRKNRLDTSILRKWKVSSWTPCSKSCGSGAQRRRVECTMRRGNHGPEMTVKDEQCSRLGLAKPRSQRPCRRIACGYIWQEGPWSECSAVCGEGMQRRSVTCHRTNRFGFIYPTPSDNCPLDQKPATEQSCKLRECNDDYYWTADPWKKCSHTCGQKGRQTRRLFCHNRKGKKVARVNCPPEFKPQRKRKCNQRKCYPVSCLEVKRNFKTTKDDEYTLVIGGRSMSIYCYGMSSSEPKEYLTLPAGDRENYAEVYDKRLMDPKTCPYNGQRNDSCHCATDIGTVSGKTMFWKIRIDPVKLYILGNDYTFSWTQGANRVEFGTAGDCYSLEHCPQGRFSINLRGTQLRLSPDIIWTGTRVDVNNINSQHVTGKCGGYCGFCKPKTGLKLDVLPP